MLQLMFSLLLITFQPPTDFHVDPELSDAADVQHFRQCIKPGLAREDEEDPFVGYPGYKPY